MKKERKAKFTKISLMAVFCVAMLSGCGKKNDVSEDFKEVQGTSLDAKDTSDIQSAESTGNKKVEQVNIKGQNYKIYFDEQDVDSKTNKVFNATKVTMSDNYLMKIASDFFDNGEFYEVTMEDYTTLNEPDGELFGLVTHEVEDMTYSYYQALLRGNRNGEPWILFAYFYNDDDATTGEFTYDFQSIESWESELYYAERDIDGFECSLDFDQTILDGENMLRELGYEGYEYVAAKGLTEQLYGATGDSRGYRLTFARNIDGNVCGDYMNRNFKLDMDEEEKTLIETVTMYFNETGLFWMSKKECYNIDENSGKEVNLFGLEEAKRVAVQEIEKNLQDEDVLGFGLDFFGSNTGMSDDEVDAKPVAVDLKYVPVFCEEDIIVVPVYLFTMDVYEEDWGTETYIVAAISALDGTVLKPDFF